MPDPTLPGKLSLMRALALSQPPKPEPKAEKPEPKADSKTMEFIRALIGAGGF